VPSAYTPGLIVRPAIKVLRERRLPIKGQVLVKSGDAVAPSTPVARAEQPGEVVAVKVAAILGVDPAEVPRLLKVKMGDMVKEGQLLAESRFFFGLFKSELKSPASGRVEYWSEVTGNLGIRLPPRPIEITAFLGGRVAEIFPGEGAMVEATAAVVQGVLGVGGESSGEVVLFDGASVLKTAQGKIAVYPGVISREMINMARTGGAAGLLGASIADEDLTYYVHEEIGAAVTGEEEVPFPLVVTEGLGKLDMPARTIEVLKLMSGKTGAISGRTQIRAGAVRPELVVPVEATAEAEEETAFALAVGKKVRLLRPPYFGQVGEVVDVPHTEEEIPTGARVPVVRVKTGAETVTVPRANVELLV